MNTTLQTRALFIAAALQNKGTETNKYKLIGIQYLRGLAALLVVVYHITTMARLPKYFNRNILGGFFEPGAVGVELFFVISGFIIVYVSLKEKELTPKLNAIPFLKRRTIRLVPFMWVTILGYVILRLIGRGTSYFPLDQYINAFFLFPLGAVEPKQIWTLRFEFLFYLFFAFTILRSKPKWELLFAWFLLPPIWSALREEYLVSGGVWMEVGDFFFSPYILLFGLGAFAGLLYLKLKPQKRIRPKYGFLFCLLLTGPLFYTSFLLNNEYESSYSFSPVLLLGLVSVIIVTVAVFLDNNTHLTKIDRFGAKLGAASYAIYLTHSAVISAVLGIWSKWQSHPNEYLLVVLIALCCCSTGIIIHNYIEKPLLQFLRQERNLKNPGEMPLLKRY